MIGRKASWGLPLKSAGRQFATPDDADDGKKHTETALKFLVSEAEKLEPEQRDLFLRGSDTGTYDEYVATLSSALKGTINTSRVSRLAKNMKPIYLLVKSIHPLMASAGQINPMPASLILGGITCIVSFANRVEEYQSKLVDLLEEMGGEIDVINDHREENLFDDDHRVRACEINIAADILQLCVKAAKKFYNDQGRERSGIVMALKAQIKDFDATFGEIKSQFLLHLRDLKNRRDIVNTRRMKIINAGVHNMSDFIDRSSKERGDNMEEENRRRREEEAKARAELRRQLLEWLPSIDFNGTQDDNLARRVSGSGDWLMRHDSFKAWKDDTRSALLWIHGKHGSGKSHLAARVIEELGALTANTPESTVAYVYCTSNPSSSTNMHLNSMLGSLFAQLCRNLSRDEEVDVLIPREGGYNTKDSPRRNELKDGIVKLVSKFRPCYIVIDGLDECSQWEDIHFKDFCSFIAELSRPSDLSTKVLVLSRPNYPDIENALAGSIKIQVDNGFNRSDIQAYISNKFSEVRPNQTEEESEGLEEIKKLLLDQSDGMFLWARLKINDLEGSTEDMREELQASSENLDDLYRKKVNDILTRSSPRTRERALRALLWVSTARRPLSKVELIEALSIKAFQKGLDSRTRLPPNQPICTECADLVVEHNGAYSLIHASLGEFLSREFLSLPDYKILQSPNATLAEACLAYLNFEVFQTTSIASTEELEEIQTKYPLLQYASKFWASHFSAAKTDHISPLTMKDKVLDFLQNGLGARASLQVLYPLGFKYNDYTEANRPNALHVIAAVNLVSFAEEVPHWRELLNCKDHISFRPIDYAIWNHDEEAIEWILDAYREAQDGGLLIKALSKDSKYDILHACARENWHRAVSRLLSLGYDCNQLDKWGETPLHDAARSGSIESLELLLNAGADITAVSEDENDTPLILAAARGHVSIMTRLLECLPAATEQPTAHVLSERMTREIQQEDHNDSSLKSDRRCTPGYGGPRSAYLERTDINGLSALLCACSSNHLRAAEFLLDHGADIRATTRNKSNAFHITARYGNAELIKVLLSRCAEPSMIDAQDQWGGRPLQDAVENKNSAAAIALLEAGAQPSLRSVGSRSPLSLAIKNGCDDVAELLIKTYAVDPTEPEDKLGSAVIVAAYEGWLKMFELLPGDRWGAITDKLSSTLLHAAAGANQVGFIKTLLSFVPDLDLVPRNRWDDTPWHHAACLGALDALVWISNVMPSALLLQGEQSRLPIHDAAFYGHLDCVKALLTERRDTVEAEDFNRLTPLILAASRKHLAVVEYLAENGANIDATDKNGATCVAYSLRAWDTRVAKYLLGRGANYQTFESDGDTPLHCAAATGDIELVEQLLDNGCNPLARGYLGRTALMTGIERGWSEVTELLLSRNPEASQILDDEGKTCLHIACIYVSPPRILQTLLDHNPKLLLGVDNLCYDAIDYAVIGGRSDLVAVLIANGMPLEGSPESLWRPIDLAGCYGGVAILEDLIKRGVSINGRGSMTDVGDGLNQACGVARVASARLLFQNGADPTLRDSLGLCALDYASNNHLLGEIFASHRQTYGGVDRKRQLAVLQETIINVSRRLTIANPGRDSKRTNLDDDLNILSQALLLFRTETSMRYLEPTWRASLITSGGQVRCAFCSEHLASEAFHVCRDYNHGGLLCSACHNNSLSPDKFTSIPIIAIVLDELDRSLRPGLAVLESFRPADILTLSICLESASLFRDWIIIMLGGYLTCERLSMASSAITPNNFPTWRLLNLFHDVQSFEWLRTEQGTDVQKAAQDDFIKSTSYTLWTAYISFRPNTEKPRLTCRGHVRIQVPSLKSVVEENGQYIDSKGVLQQSFYEDIAQHYSDLRSDEITDFIESESASHAVSESEIAEDYEKVRNIVGSRCAKFMTCFMSQDSVKKDLDKAFKEIWSKARPLFQKLESSDGNDAGLEDVNRKIRAYEIAWKTAQAIFHVPFEVSLQEAERNRRKAVSDGPGEEHDEKGKAIVEELETMKSPKRTLTAESMDNYDTASEASGRESWRSAGEYLEHVQVSDRSGDDEEIVWETCSES